jgi:hypothetical protein
MGKPEIFSRNRGAAATGKFFFEPVFKSRGAKEERESQK